MKRSAQNYGSLNVPVQRMKICDPVESSRINRSMDWVLRFLSIRSRMNPEVYKSADWHNRSPRRCTFADVYECDLRFSFFPKAVWRLERRRPATQLPRDQTRSTGWASRLGSVLSSGCETACTWHQLHHSIDIILIPGGEENSDPAKFSIPLNIPHTSAETESLCSNLCSSSRSCTLTLSQGEIKLQFAKHI